MKAVSGLFRSSDQLARGYEIKNSELTIGRHVDMPISHVQTRQTILRHLISGIGVPPQARINPRGRGSYATR